MRAGSRRVSCLCEVIGRTSIVAFAIATLASGAFTQSQTGTLIGLIRDPQHTVITGAEVQLSRVDASQPVSHAITDSKGRFHFAGLPAGVYSLEVILPGWQGQHFSDLTIDAARTLDVNIVLLPARPAPHKQFPSLQSLDRDVLVGRRLGQCSMHELATIR